MPAPGEIGGLKGVTPAEAAARAETLESSGQRLAALAWKQIADVIPAYAAQVRPIEAAARIVSLEEVGTGDSRLVSRQPKALASGDYGIPETPVKTAEPARVTASDGQGEETDGQIRKQDMELELEDRRREAKSRDALRDG